MTHTIVRTDASSFSCFDSSTSASSASLFSSHKIGGKNANNKYSVSCAYQFETEGEESRNDFANEETNVQDDEEDFIFESEEEIEYEKSEARKDREQEKSQTFPSFSTACDLAHKEQKREKNYQNFAKQKPKNKVEQQTNKITQIETNNFFLSGSPQAIGCSNANYICLSLNNIQIEMNKIVEETAELLGIHNDIAFLMLRMYRWQAEDLTQDWFANSESILQRMNISESTLSVDYSFSEEKRKTDHLSTTEFFFFCDIIAESVPFAQTTALPCQHRFSNICWQKYLTSAIDEGPEKALSKRCPEYSCGELVRSCVWKNLAPKKVYEKYLYFKSRCFVDEGIRIRWCSNPECENAVMLLHNYLHPDVQCDCGMAFCLFCGKEPHRPIPCKIIADWNVKNQSEADNVTWVLVHTKNCPKCKEPIEKNQGCMHMTCRCRYEFCWLCLGDWKKHTSSSVYRCNIFDSAPPDPKEEEKKRAKESLERYAHYFERYRAHNHGQNIASKDQMKLVQSQVREIQKIIGEISEVEFLEKAVLQIVECRRILKWSYAFGYFANWNKIVTKKDLFEYHQGQLETNLDRLQEKTERFRSTDYFGFQRNKIAEFLNFKAELVDLTRGMHTGCDSAMCLMYMDTIAFVFAWISSLCS